MGAKVIEFAIVKFNAARVIGKSVVQSLGAAEEDLTIPNLWDALLSSGKMGILLDLDGLVNEWDRVGWGGDVDPQGGIYTYLAGVLTVAATPVPKGFEYRDIPEGIMAYAQLEETRKDGISVTSCASELVAREAARYGYVYDGSRGSFELEYYARARYEGRLKQGKPVILDYFSPCKKKAERA
ncbi:MAG: hypothetical protein LLG09_00080 [Negativicutes bacterium]|nr:hypothetical protein [Negativicutes bacterium]